MRFNRKTDIKKRGSNHIVNLYSIKKKNNHQAGIGTSTWSELDEADQKIMRKQASSLRCRCGFNHGEFNKKLGPAWIRW